jgi:hypothetical protein
MLTTLDHRSVYLNGSQYSAIKPFYDGNTSCPIGRLSQGLANCCEHNLKIIAYDSSFTSLIERKTSVLNMNAAVCSRLALCNPMKLRL